MSDTPIRFIQMQRAMAETLDAILALSDATLVLIENMQPDDQDSAYSSVRTALASSKHALATLKDLADGNG